MDDYIIVALAIGVVLTIISIVRKERKRNKNKKQY